MFNSFEFWMFFAAVMLACQVSPPRGARAILVVASFAFYGMWDTRLMLLLAACVVFNFFTGLAIGGALQAGRGAKALLAFAVAANLGLLGFFKYFGFFVASLSSLATLPAGVLALHVVLPVAISFYTFEAISYNVDVYRGNVPARRNFVDFALFISFFPHLVAGPIIRPGHFFPQLAAHRRLSGEDLRWGAVQIVKGLIKKTVFADNFAVIANAYFNGGVGESGALAAWIGTLAFSMQIYFDFAGYTDIARGCARLLGYEFPPNFERPYLAANIAEFWRRWHISLSTWLRDYLYIPLGGNRRGKARVYVNLLITMGLGGLWHGASWNFLAWGLYHGILLAAHRAWREWRGAPPPVGAVRHALGRAAATAVTFLGVTLGWVAFRAPDFATTWKVLGDLFAGSLAPDLSLPDRFLPLIIATLLWVVLDRDRRLQYWLSSGAGFAGMLKVSSAFALALLVLELFSRTDISVPFIYFQF
nr:MBOAT family protein [Limobrevibacterium gyesilva]